MGNFFRDNQDIEFLLSHKDLSEVIKLREKNFQEAKLFDYAPANETEALENYKIVLDILGDICANTIYPNARDVDIEGVSLKDGEVYYARGTQENLKRLRQAEVMGFTLPRRYGGLNLPKTIYSLATEMVSRADASLMNLFGLQEIADTIYRFGSEDQRKRYLPRFARGEVSGAMALTEPDAGSDLQAVSMKAEEGKDGKWYLTGVKRFITNGCGNILLVLARSEKDSKGGRGLSLFIYERDSTMRIRRIEEKLGIHGSPTCELQFNNSPAELLGERRMGLIKYTLSLMNGARLAVAAQGVGIAEAAYRAAREYALSRNQFGVPIITFPAIDEMLSLMRVKIEAARRLVFLTSTMVDLKESLEEMAQEKSKPSRDLRNRIKKYTKYASLLTPMTKIFATEMANKVTYDAIQIHGGVGFTKDFEVERLYRDVRVTNIYEGTTQLQVIGAIGGITTGVIFELLTELAQQKEMWRDILPELQRAEKELKNLVEYLKEKENDTFRRLHSRRLVEMATYIVMGYLLANDAYLEDKKKKLCLGYLDWAQGKMEEIKKRILDCKHRTLFLWQE